MPHAADATLVAPGQVRVARALVSVSDKRGVAEFARGLAQLGVEIVSTGGTARALAEAGVPTRPVEALTGFPEIMDGRVKTLHPALHAGLLARRDDPAHVAAAADHGVEWIDLVCVNLYPFERTSARPGAQEREVLEEIDIGGPTLLRAAAKNFAWTAAVARPELYDEVLAELREGDLRLSLATRRRLAADAFATTARYDAAIAGWFAGEGTRHAIFDRARELPYGENPHQRAAYWVERGAPAHLLSGVQQHGGKPLSFNNLLDLQAVRALLEDLGEHPACAIVKHNTPCGCALGADPASAYARAFAADPLSAYGGVIGLNRPVDGATARRLVEQFVEVLWAPGYVEDALEVLAAKPNLRVLEQREPAPLGDEDWKRVLGGLLVQDRDAGPDPREDMRVASRRAPTEAEWQDLAFAWAVVRHVRSNAIVLAADRATIGIGAGQMSRVDAVRIALEKAPGERLRGAALASDAYFPFADGPELAFARGVSAVVQPGGSRRDAEAIAAADRAGAAMVLTGRRHFRH
jgi:phosphoribosylaminoimidazolecarboxamide formyltransferase/IMP cyclohydrolase